MTYQTIRIDKTGSVDWLTLNRPDRLNALNDQMIDELLDYFQRLETQASVRVVMIRGAGRAFCAGFDLHDADHDPTFEVSEGLASQRRISEIAVRMRRAPQVIVSLVHGAACGGGFAIALASDIRIAGQTARLNVASIRLGLSGCDIGTSYFLPRLVGASLAAELMFTGDFINADRALAASLVSRVVRDEELNVAAAELAERLLAASPIGLRVTKEGLRMSIDAPCLEAAIAMEDRNQVLCARDSAFAEGVAAFAEKRRPRYAESIEVADVG